MTGTTAITDNLNGEPIQRPLIVRIFAHFISYVFHPLFIPVYMAGYLLFVHPLLFAGFSAPAKFRLLATIIVNLTLLPAVTVFLCRRLGFISSVQMDTQKERIIPLAAAMIFYFWCWFVLRNFTEVPLLFRQFLLGCFITIIAAWLANIYFKVSLHALAVGGLAGFTFVTLFMSVGGTALFPAITLLLGGLVCSARLLLNAHRPSEVYSGFLIGVFCQLLAVWLS